MCTYFTTTTYYYYYYTFVPRQNKGINIGIAISMSCRVGVGLDWSVLLNYLLTREHNKRFSLEQLSLLHIFSFAGILSGEQPVSLLFSSTNKY